MVAVYAGLSGLGLCLLLARAVIGMVETPLEETLAQRGRPAAEIGLWRRLARIGLSLTPLWGALSFFPDVSQQDVPSLWNGLFRQAQAGVAGLLLALAVITVGIIATARLQPRQDAAQPPFYPDKGFPPMDYRLYSIRPDELFPNNEGWDSDYEAPPQ
ncbi:MAG: hypothetical protein IT210_19430 [Armatimonadetes bacterium]|nr:hypothetical protein [Armatimonadota bacterium]